MVSITYIVTCSWRPNKSKRENIVCDDCMFWQYGCSTIKRKMKWDGGRVCKILKKLFLVT